MPHIRDRTKESAVLKKLYYHVNKLPFPIAGAAVLCSVLELATRLNRTYIGFNYYFVPGPLTQDASDDLPELEDESDGEDDEIFVDRWL